VLVDPRVLDVRVGKGVHDAAVELRAGIGVDPLAAVVPLEVDDVDRAGRRELRDDLVRPAVARVDLEAERGRELQPGADVTARRDDEPERS
jgi:hypothetical protein